MTTTEKSNGGYFCRVDHGLHEIRRVPLSLISDLVTVPSARLNSAHGPELLPTTPRAADFLMPKADELISVINKKQRFRWKDSRGNVEL